MAHFYTRAALIGILIIAAVMVIWLAMHAPQPLPDAGSPPSKRIGKSALSHGAIPGEMPAVAPAPPPPAPTGIHE